MNEVTFVLAILVDKDILTLQEAAKLKKSLTQSTINSNLKNMIEKVDKALAIKEDEIETISAVYLLK
jgi:hypothetical protein